MPRKKPKLKQRDFWGGIVQEPKRKPSKGLVPLMFQDHEVRMTTIAGEQWWVAVDVCRVLGLDKVTQAVAALDDDEKTTLCNTEGGGRAHTLNLVSTPGLFVLMTRSRKPQAKAFRRWIFHEVLPSIQEHGCYPPPSRASRQAKRLKCDPNTAELRVKQLDINKYKNDDVISKGGGPRDCAAWHNGGYRGQFGKDKDAKALRSMVGIPPHKTPLDHMGAIPLAQNYHAKLLADKIIKHSGPMSLEEEATLLQKVASLVTESDFDRLASETGDDFIFGIVDDPSRGKIIDVIQKSLPSPK